MTPFVAHRENFEISTLRLTAERSASELPVNLWASIRYRTGFPCLQGRTSSIKCFRGKCKRFESHMLVGELWILFLITMKRAVPANGSSQCFEVDSNASCRMFWHLTDTISSFSGFSQHHSWRPVAHGSSEEIRTLDPWFPKPVLYPDWATPLCNAAPKCGIFIFKIITQDTP